MAGKIAEMIAQGVEFWNDSCDLRELEDAVDNGAVGATSNPVIVATVVKDDAERLNRLLKRLDRDHPGLSDEALAWKWIEAIAIDASKLLRGDLNVQVNPENARDPQKMIEQARHLASLAPNLAIKLPAIKEGLQAIAVLSAEGIRTNATVSFSVPQAIAAAEAGSRYVTIMVGRVADHLKKVQDAEMVLADPGVSDWAGIAIFKKAYRLFQERGYRSTLIAAAYRHQRQWSELIGPGLIQSIPYKWWKAFDATHVHIARTIDEPVPNPIFDQLVGYFPDFNRAYDEHGMTPEEFEHYGASVATLHQFRTGYRDLVDRVRGLR